MRGPSLIALPDPEWIDVLRRETEKPGRTKQAVANELGVSRTAVSLLCAGKYTAKLDKVTGKVAPKVMEIYAHRIWCPHVVASIAETACAAHRSAPMPQSDPTALRQWAACRSCPQNPRTEKVTDAG